MATWGLPAEILQAFSDRPDLVHGIRNAITLYPGARDVFLDVSKYVNQLKRTPPAPAGANGAEGPAPKKRKLEGNGIPTRPAAPLLPSNVSSTAYYTEADVSFSVPQRKKLALSLVANSHNGGGVYASSAEGVEFGVPWHEIEQVFCLPIPEKTKRQHNFVVIPRNGDGVTPVPEGVTPPEPMVWTYVEPTGKALKEGENPGPEAMAARLDSQLQHYQKRVVFPTDNEFSSSIPQPHRKGEKAYHVKAFRGSKDGFLFFTSAGILWAFKKPLALFTLDAISAISYTSILQRTFNLVVSVFPPDTSSASLTEVEFSMLDQADYDNIQQYVRRHGLHDASLAAERKAKRLNINGPPTSQATEGRAANGMQPGAGGHEEESELLKAERQLQDQEDEMEEDFEPDEDLSDGSGSSEEESEGEEDDYDEYDDEDKDLVADELGSEAEEVELSDQE